MRSFLCLILVICSLFVSISAVAYTEQLKAELGDIDAQLNAQPSKFFYRLNQIKPQLNTYDAYTQQYFWTIYCEASVRMELYEEVIEQVNAQLNQGQKNYSAEHRVALLMCRADAKLALGKHQQSALDLNMALEIATRSKYEELLIEALIKLGDLNTVQSLYAQGHRFLQEAYERAKRLNNEDLFNSVNAALGSFYSYKKEFAKAIPFYEKVREYHLKKGYLQQASISVFNLGVIANKLEDYPQALLHLTEAKELSEQVSDIPGIAYAELKMVPALMAFSRYDEAQNSLEVARNFFVTQNNRSKLAEVGFYQAKLDSYLARYEQAITRLNSALSVYKEFELLSEQAMVLLELSKNYQQLKDDKKALHYYRQYHQVDTELAKRQNEEVTQRLSAEFEAERKESENVQLKKLLEIEQETVKAQKQTQNLQIGLIVSAILLIIFAAFYLFKQYSYGKKMRALAMRDDLTQIANRRAIMASLKKAVSWSLRYQEPLSVAIFDIDNFKKFNDNFGHDVGDKVLAEFAQTLIKAIRATDDFGRLGGEEFMLIMPNTSTVQAKVLLSRVMPAIRALRVPVKGKHYYITASAGVTEFDIKNETLMDLYGRADTALYLAKEAGRDQYKIT